LIATIHSFGLSGTENRQTKEERPQRTEKGVERRGALKAREWIKRRG